MLCLLFLLYTAKLTCAFTGQCHSSYKPGYCDNEIAKGRFLSSIGHTDYEKRMFIGLLDYFLLKDSHNSTEKSLKNRNYVILLSSSDEKVKWRIRRSILDDRRHAERCQVRTMEQFLHPIVSGKLKRAVNRLVRSLSNIDFNRL